MLSIPLYLVEIFLLSSFTLALPVGLSSSTSSSSTGSKIHDKRAPSPAIFHPCAPEFDPSSRLNIVSSFNNDQFWDLNPHSNSSLIQSSNYKYDELSIRGNQWIINSASNNTFFELRSTQDEACISVDPLSDSHLTLRDCYSIFSQSTLFFNQSKQSLGPSNYLTFIFSWFEISCQSCNSSPPSATSTNFSQSSENLYSYSHNSPRTTSSRLVGQNCQIRNVAYHQLIENEIREVEDEDEDRVESDLTLGRMNFDTEGEEEVGLFEYESLWDFEWI